MQIGVLALQGAFIEHRRMLAELNIDSFEIRKPSDLERPMDGLIIPGGESTTMFKLLNDLEMTNSLKSKINSGLPVMGTCAGLILLANKVENYKHSFLQTMDVTAVKNAYGRQLGSFRATGTFNNIEVPFVFIRAPFISKTSDNVEVLSELEGNIIAARQDNQLVTAFHPELTNDLTIHKYFINMI